MPRLHRLHTLERSQRVARPIDEVFAYFSDAANLETLTPDFLHFRILTPLPIEMREGALIEYALALFGVPIRWRTRITHWQPGVRFVDEQERGPFAVWRHTHTFEPEGDSVLLGDRVEYAEPLGALGLAAHHLFVQRIVERIFDFRRETIGRQLGAAPNDPAVPAERHA